MTWADDIAAEHQRIKDLNDEKLKLSKATIMMNPGGMLNLQALLGDDDELVDIDNVLFIAERTIRVPIGPNVNCRTFAPTVANTPTEINSQSLMQAVRSKEPNDSLTADLPIGFLGEIICGRKDGGLKVPTMYAFNCKNRRSGKDTKIRYQVGSQWIPLRYGTYRDIMRDFGRDVPPDSGRLYAVLAESAAIMKLVSPELNNETQIEKLVHGNARLIIAQRELMDDDTTDDDERSTMSRKREELQRMISSTYHLSLAMVNGRSRLLCIMAALTQRTISDEIDDDHPFAANEVSNDTWMNSKNPMTLIGIRIGTEPDHTASIELLQEGLKRISADSEKVQRLARTNTLSDSILRVTEVYKNVDTLTANNHIAKKWDEDELDAYAKIRNKLPEAMDVILDTKDGLGKMLHESR